MTIDIYILAAILMLAVTAAAYFGGKQSAIKASAKEDGERWGRVEATLEYVKKSVDDIKVDSKNAASKDDVRAVNDRIDAHLRNDHGIIVKNA